MPDFRILGPLEVVGDHGSIALGGQKQRALLGLLLMRAGEVVATDRLVDQLWGEHPPKTATTSLQNLVSQLRKLLGPDLLVTRPPGYVLHVEAERVDLGRFERLVAEARRLLRLWSARRSCARRSRSGEDRRSRIWRSRRSRRQRSAGSRSSVLEAVEERIDADLELGRRSSLVSELEVLVSQLPLRERLRGQLMLALYRSGRQAEALDVYHAGRLTLSERARDRSRPRSFSSCTATSSARSRCLPRRPTLRGRSRITTPRS